MYFFNTFCHFINTKCRFSHSFFFSRVLNHIPAQYVNDQNCFPFLISLLDINSRPIILCELRDQGGGGGDVIISAIGKPYLVKKYMAA